MKRFGIATGIAVLTLSALTTGPLVASAAPPVNPVDVLVSNGSPQTTFPRNKQNEPAIAVNPLNPKEMVAGANEEIDNAPCSGTNCSFTPGVGDNGIYISQDRGKTWVQPTYQGWSARTGTAAVGPIGTVPLFYEAGLVSDGDPALAYGPVPKNGTFSWSNGARLYYSSLTSNFPGRNAFNAFEAIAVSRTDSVSRAATGGQATWRRPIIASKQMKPHTFSDKEAIWADNAATSAYFGNAYLCWVSFDDTTSPIVFARSTDGGDTWSNPVTVFPFTPTATTGPTSCTIRTDSAGKVYVLWEQVNNPNLSHMMMARSSDGGVTFDAPQNVADVTEVGKADPVHDANGDPRFTLDGIGGARTFSGLQVDIANGAPTGSDATNQMVMTWADARNGLDHEEALLRTSSNSGDTWTTPRAIQSAGDRPDFPAIAISPNGLSVYLVYDAFITPWRNDTHQHRTMQGVVRGASVSGGVIGPFGTVHRAKPGEARGSSENNGCCGFLGDYNYVVATRTFGAAVWNDVRNAADCTAMDQWRASLLTTPKPHPATDCPATFGNTDIYGGVYTLQ